MDLWVVDGLVHLHERVVRNSERKARQALELKLVERIRSVYNRIGHVFLLLLDGFDVLVKLLSLGAFKFSQLFCAFKELAELPCEGRYLHWKVRVEDKVDNTTVCTLDQTRLLPAALLGHHGVLDEIFLLAKGCQLVLQEPINHSIRLLILLSVNKDRAEQLVFVSHLELVLEAVTPVRVFCQLAHSAHETAREELFRDVEAL